MKEFCIRGFEVECWQKENKNALRKVQRQQKIVDEDPLSVLTQTKTQLNHLLHEYKNKHPDDNYYRLVKELSYKEELARAMSNSFDLGLELEKLHEIKNRQSLIDQKLTSVLNMYQLMQRKKGSGNEV